MSKIVASIRNGWLVVAKPLSTVATQAQTGRGYHLVSTGGHRNVPIEGSDGNVWVKLMATTDADTAEALGLHVGEPSQQTEDAPTSIDDLLGSKPKASKSRRRKTAGSIHE